MAEEVFKLITWNNLIDAVNNVRANPPADTDCEPLPPIDHWPNTTAFSRGEVTRVRNAAAETSPDISFPDLQTPQTIERRLLTDIQDALALSWSQCQPDDSCRDEDGQTTVLRSDAWEVYSSFDPSDEGEPCGYPPAPEGGLGDSFAALDYIAGQIIALPNRILRSWEIFWTAPNGSEVFLANGPILCSGVPDTSAVDPDDTLMFETAWADASCTIGDTCETCGAKFDFLNGAEPRRLCVRIFASFAACVEECPPE